MEESRGARLRRNLDALQGDLDAAQRAQGQMEVVAKAAQQYVVDEHARMEQVRVGGMVEHVAACG